MMVAERKAVKNPINDQHKNIPRAVIISKDAVFLLFEFMALKIINLCFPRSIIFETLKNVYVNILQATSKTSFMDDDSFLDFKSEFR